MYCRYLSLTGSVQTFDTKWKLQRRASRGKKVCALKSTRVGCGVGNTTNSRIWMATDCQTCLARALANRLHYDPTILRRIFCFKCASPHTRQYFTLARTEHSDNVDAFFAFSSTASFVRLLSPSRWCTVLTPHSPELSLQFFPISLQPRSCFYSRQYISMYFLRTS